jgi:hypothetical protein
MRCAIGCRDHSGWAVLVAVGGDPAAPEVLARERVALLDDALPRMVFHAALETTLSEGAALVSQVEQAAAVGATEALRTMHDRLGANGHEVAGVAIAVGTTEVPDDLATILASHARVHAAEGELYRDALVEGATELGLPVTRFANKGAVSGAAQVLGVDTEHLSARLAALRAVVGAPWQRDHREATAGALLVLAG